ncbi:MAG: hypothetical protein JWL73_3852 [Actinomycetia bacterium]|nr:hypothetical protein [Actinomycetes bacterium]
MNGLPETSGGGSTIERSHMFKAARKSVLVLGVAGSMLAGGAVGAVVFAAGSSSAATTPTSTTAVTGTTGVDNSNKDPAHEAGESATRAADEKAGKVGGGPDGHSNTDPAHEAAESPARAAEEATHDAAVASGSTTTTAAPAQ